MEPKVGLTSEVESSVVEPELPSAEGVHSTEEREEQPQILAELVIEEVGIDGMCGVY